jgi:hypothetical protein
MAKSTIEKRMMKYSALAAAAIAGIGSADAQIQYTDIPDQNVANPTVYPLDLDGDGTNDIQFRFRTYMHSTYIATAYSGGGATTGGFWSVDASWQQALAAPLSYGGNNNQILRTSSSWSGYGYAAALSKSNSHVSASQYFGGSALLASIYTDGLPYQNFSDWQEHYLGLMFYNTDGAHYGWVRLKVNSGALDLDIMDYGYEDTPDASIHAGGFPTTYTDAGSGNWNDVANWDKGIPTDEDDAVIPSGQSVTLDADATCFNFMNSGNVSLGSYILDVGAHFKSPGAGFNGGTGLLNFTGDFTVDAERHITNSLTKAVNYTFPDVTVNNANVSYSLDYVTDIEGTFDIQACNVFTNNTTLYLNGNMTVATGTTFTNDGDFTLGSTFGGDGSILNDGTMDGIGTYNVQKYLADSRWFYVGSPMASETSDAFGSLSSTSGSGIRLLEWDEITAAYSDLTTGAEVLNPMQGYTYHNYNAGVPETAVFTGTLNNGPLSDNTLSRTATGTYDGFNLVSNPYPSAIDIEVFGPSTVNLEPTVWFKSGPVYPTYNWVSDIGADGGQQYIPAMQAFWVNVITDPGTISLDNTARLHNSQAFYKKEPETNVFRLEVVSGQLKDETVVHFNDNATDNFDPYDSKKMFSSDNNLPEIYTLSSDNEMEIINGLPLMNIGDEKIVPLGFSTDQAGTFTLQASNLDVFEPGTEVYLEDQLLAVIKDLRDVNSYTFYSDVVNDANRFKLHFGSITTDINTVELADGYAYANQNTIYVNTPDANCSVELYDMTGKLIMSKLSEKGLNIMQTNAGKGVYVVKILNGNKLSTDKIFIQ